MEGLYSGRCSRKNNWMLMWYTIEMPCDDSPKTVTLYNKWANKPTKKKTLLMKIVKFRALNGNHLIQPGVQMTKFTGAESLLKSQNPPMALSSVDRDEKIQSTINYNTTDLIWGVSRACTENSSIPAWSGFTSHANTVVLPAMAIVRYLPFINGPPSDFSTICTTLIMFVLIASALVQNHILVTADLAIYKQSSADLMEQTRSYIWEGNNATWGNAPHHGVHCQHSKETVCKRNTWHPLSS